MQTTMTDKQKNINESQRRKRGPIKEYDWEWTPYQLKWWHRVQVLFLFQRIINLVNYCDKDRNHNHDILKYFCCSLEDTGKIDWSNRWYFVYWSISSRRSEIIVNFFYMCLLEGTQMMLSATQTYKMVLSKSVLTELPRHTCDWEQRANWTSKGCQRLFCGGRLRSSGWFFDLCSRPPPPHIPHSQSSPLFSWSPPSFYNYIIIFTLLCFTIFTLYFV